VLGMNISYRSVKASCFPLSHWIVHFCKASAISAASIGLGGRLFKFGIQDDCASVVAVVDSRVSGGQSDHFPGQSTKSKQLGDQQLHCST
jgi:hypothetical protein